MFGYIQKAVMKGLQNITRSAQGEIARRIAYEVKSAQRRLIKSLISFFLMGIAFIFLALGTVYMGIEYLSFNKTLAFLTVGIFILLLGIIIKITE